MVSWAITGATRGIGFGFVQNLSTNPETQVFALIRSLTTAGPVQALAATRKNIHIIVTDLAKPKRLEEAAAEVAGKTGGKLDVLVLNAGSAVPETTVWTPTAYTDKYESLEHEINENVKNNIISHIYTTHAFLPLLRASTTSTSHAKIISIGSASGDLDVTITAGLPAMLGYSIAKAGMNLTIAKFGIELAAEGIHTLSISPGWVATEGASMTTKDPATLAYTLSAFGKMKAGLEGPIEVDESVACMVKIVEGLKAEDSGRFVTHRGDFVVQREGVDWF